MILENPCRARLTQYRPYPVREYAEETAAAVDREVKDIVDRIIERTEGMMGLETQE
ncbi:hypothetical protein J6500_09215 [Bradyrhizobium sp. WSM 1704]|uniref:hypothetical protein n=1 Tax=Bradyrhizobium semiaridum TaxID=2821404 RepID=UPI001CE27E2D|nr:hypothetical protein [Bradyrhizobium semiaridum]MCA6122073.1 hypothetical protein [Bradyrhizobium semiaridum]